MAAGAGGGGAVVADGAAGEEGVAAVEDLVVGLPLPSAARLQSIAVVVDTDTRSSRKNCNGTR